MIYMTREGIEYLSKELDRLLAADPKEFFEVHIMRSFTSMDMSGKRHEPHIAFLDGLGPIISELRWRQLRADQEAGEADQDTVPAQFEVTIMHVPPGSVDKSRKEQSE